jgi:hypothetical protein
VICWERAGLVGRTGAPLEAGMGPLVTAPTRTTRAVATRVLRPVTGAAGPGAAAVAEAATGGRTEVRAGIGASIRARIRPIPARLEAAALAPAIAAALTATITSPLGIAMAITVVEATLVAVGRTVEAALAARWPALAAARAVSTLEGPAFAAEIAALEVLPVAAMGRALEAAGMTAVASSVLAALMATVMATRMTTRMTTITPTLIVRAIRAVVRPGVGAEIRPTIRSLRGAMVGATLVAAEIRPVVTAHEGTPITLATRRAAITKTRLATIRTTVAKAAAAVVASLVTPAVTAPFGAAIPRTGALRPVTAFETARASPAFAVAVVASRRATVAETAATLRALAAEAFLALLAFGLGGAQGRALHGGGSHRAAVRVALGGRRAGFLFQGQGGHDGDGSRGTDSVRVAAPLGAGRSSDGGQSVWEQAA